MLIRFLLFMNIVWIYQADGYRHTIFAYSKPLCTNLKCGNKPHTACQKFEEHEDCKGFHFIEMNRHMMIMSHNGIRNKIAREWKIGNMNILHWSRELELLSKLYLLQCDTNKDTCDFLVSKDITIGQNIFVSDSFGSRWIGRAIRSWYAEMGYFIRSFDEFAEAVKKDNSKAAIAQMIWPKTEFLGCAASRVETGYMIVCYYHPKGSFEHLSHFVKAEPCTSCPRDRITCAKEFTQLCGLDNDIDIGNTLKAQRVSALMLLIVIVKYFQVFHERLCFTLLKY